ncbi:MAG: hypothetical protein QM756_18875 [Polyangiaceae bacterium]
MASDDDPNIRYFDLPSVVERDYALPAAPSDLFHLDAYRLEDPRLHGTMASIGSLDGSVVDFSVDTHWNRSAVGVGASIGGRPSNVPMAHVWL